LAEGCHASYQPSDASTPYQDVFEDSIFEAEAEDLEAKVEASDLYDEG